MMHVLFDTIARVKRLFCRHEYEEEFLAGFLVVDPYARLGSLGTHCIYRDPCNHFGSYGIRRYSHE